MDSPLYDIMSSDHNQLVQSSHWVQFDSPQVQHDSLEVPLEPNYYDTNFDKVDLIPNFETTNTHNTESTVDLIFDFETTSTHNIDNYNFPSQSICGQTPSNMNHIFNPKLNISLVIMFHLTHMHLLHLKYPQSLFLAM